MIYLRNRVKIGNTSSVSDTQTAVRGIYQFLDSVVLIICGKQTRFSIYVLWKLLQREPYRGSRFTCLPLFRTHQFIGNVSVCLAVYGNASLFKSYLCPLPYPTYFLSLLSGLSSYPLSWLANSCLTKQSASSKHWRCTLVGVSLYLMALIAVNHHCCVVKPENYRAIFSCKSTFTFVLSTWFGLWL